MLDMIDSMASEILIYGGSGKLGKAIQSLQTNVICPERDLCDITDGNQVNYFLDKYKPKIVINCAALVGTKECELDKQKAWATNVEGAINIARACQEIGARHVYISSAAIFDGNKGLYKESDYPTPTFYYAMTKVAAEQGVQMLPNFAIIRLDFYIPEALKYKQVFVDHFTSKISVEDAAQKILRVAMSSFMGIINIGQERKSLYEILKLVDPDIAPIKIADSSLPTFPKDISLDLGLWNRLYNTPSP